MNILEAFKNKKRYNFFQYGGVRLHEMKKTITLIIAVFGVACSAIDRTEPSSADGVVVHDDLGTKNSDGLGLVENHAKAASWYLKDAEAGYAPAQYNLAHIYFNGLGVTKDVREAFRWYLRAAESGLSEAQFNVALMFREGQGVEKSLRDAIKWSFKAAQQGHADAQFNLGSWYGRGEGTPVIEHLAFYWYLKAAKQGNENAKVIVGGRYHVGLGTVRDPQRGHAWLLLGSSQLATDYLNAFAKKMTSDELKAAEDLAKTCRDSDYQNC